MKVGLGWIILLLFCYHTLAQDEETDEESSVIELQLADFDLTYAYDEISEASKNHLLNITGYDVKVQLEKDLGNLLRIQSKTNNKLNDVPYDYNRNWNLLTKTGSFLLPKEEFEKLIDFSNENEELSQYSKVLNGIVNKQDYLNALATERNVTVLSELWSSWQNNFYSNKDEFFSVLSLLNNTSILNDENSAQTYWEMQSEYTNGYKEAQKLWNAVQPLYKTLYDFVKLRLYNYYGLNDNDDDVPVYLLGSNFGNDWSNIADIVLPHSYLYSEVNQKLKERSVKSIYKLGEGMTQNINLKALGKEFWKRSNFNFSSCGPHIFSHCNKKYSEILTCDKLDFTKFMDIHESAINVALRNQDYGSLARRQMRYSAVDEAIQGLGSLIAIHSLPRYGFVSGDGWTDTFDQYNIKNSALLIMALRVLPKLPYYLLADTWRLDELKSSEGDFTENWWTKRRQMQGVRGNTNDEVDFLGDPLISSNKPQLSKFLGIFLQFQLYDYYNKFYSLEDGTIVDFIQQDANFIKFIEDRPNKSWFELLSFYYNIDKISSDALLEYFEPLEYYLEQVNEERRMSSISTKELNTVTGTDDFHSSTESVIFDTSFRPNSAKSTPSSSSHEKVWILLGVGGLVLVAIVLFMFIRRIRRKRKSNNRRFET